MTYTHNHTPMPTKKSAGAQFKEDMFYFAIIIGVYYTIVGIFKILTAPFVALFTTDTIRLDRSIKIAKDKVEARTEARYAYEHSEDNMLEQYIKRFKTQPDNYPYASVNQDYKDWFDGWQNGTLLDSNLLWAPEVYVTDYEKQKCWNIEFLDYFQRQLDLHMQDTFLVRHNFLKTIRNFYPEFTPKFSVIPSEIKELRELAKESNLRMELIDAIEKKGIPRSYALELVDTCSPDLLKKKISIAKKCVDLGFFKDMMNFCIETGYDPSDELAPTINNIVSRVGNTDIASALIRGTITAEELLEITNKACSLYDQSDSEDAERWRKSIGYSFERLMKAKVLKGC